MGKEKLAALARAFDAAGGQGFAALLGLFVHGLLDALGFFLGGGVRAFASAEAFAATRARAAFAGPAGAALFLRAFDLAGSAMEEQGKAGVGGLLADAVIQVAAVGIHEELLVVAKEN